ncbi:MAG: urea ABC transporter permease subunit UrtB, partial [Candidatus Accumulibacter sp.]|nr:urea ABC transporter permease subunit UrtB [Accumulibacter sp.]
MTRFLFSLVFFAMTATRLFASDAQSLRSLALGDNDEKIAALEKIAAEGKSDFLPVLEALREDALYVRKAGADAPEAVFVALPDGGATKVWTKERFAALPEGSENVTINNRVRSALGNALAALRLFSGDRGLRRAAVDALSAAPRPEMLPSIERAILRESDPGIRRRLETAHAMILIHETDKNVRLRALDVLSETSDVAVRRLLDPLTSSAETDAEVRTAALRVARAIDARLARGEILGRIFSGVSLGSILLLAALGLAVIYGLMGVINMAHGEFIMIGAYAAYVTQNAFRNYLPAYFDWYPLLALPVAFLASALTGVFLERIVIRHLYGRPLETLLATWGISLALIQTVRSVFGAQNVSVENPVWLSGGIEVYSNLILPYNRLAILAFAAAVLGVLAALLGGTRLGLTVRAVTQNRPMARCLGVSTSRVDALGFGLGAGLAGLAGCALSQVGNVGP